MGRRTEEPDSPTADERERVLNWASASMLKRLRFLDMRRGPVVPSFSGPLHDALERAMALPAGRERRDAIELAGRRHLGDAVFERLCRGQLMRIRS